MATRVVTSTAKGKDEVVQLYGGVWRDRGQAVKQAHLGEILADQNPAALASWKARMNNKADAPATVVDASNTPADAQSARTTKAAVLVETNTTGSENETDEKSAEGDADSSVGALTAGKNRAYSTTIVPGRTPAETALAGPVGYLECLDVDGVRAWFESLGLNNRAIHRHRQSLTGAQDCDGDGASACYHEQIAPDIDGAELARITRADNPHAELHAIGIRARLHRVKLLAALRVTDGGPCERADAVNRASITAKHHRVRFPLVDAPGGERRHEISSTTHATPAVTALKLLKRLRREQEATAAALTTSIMRCTIDDGTGLAIAHGQKRLHLAAPMEHEKERDVGSTPRNDGVNLIADACRQTCNGHRGSTKFEGDVVAGDTSAIDGSCAHPHRVETNREKESKQKEESATSTRMRLNFPHQFKSLRAESGNCQRQRVVGEFVCALTAEAVEAVAPAATVGVRSIERGRNLPNSHQLMSGLEEAISAQAGISSQVPIDEHKVMYRSRHLLAPSLHDHFACCIVVSFQVRFRRHSYWPT